MRSASVWAKPTTACGRCSSGAGSRRRNFKNSKNKLAYSYLLTPSGIDAKARITARFLKRKIGEYEALKAEIAQLTAEVEQGGSVSEHKHQ